VATVETPQKRRQKSNEFRLTRERGGNLRSEKPGLLDLFLLRPTEWKASRNLRNVGRS
jgi:hypothetical protein